VGWAIDFLSSRLDHGWTTQIRHATIEMPQQRAIERLALCHRALSLRERALQERFPDDGESFSLGGSACGVTIRFRPRNRNWWQIESITESTA
jgi:hypothetical protein